MAAHEISLDDDDGYVTVKLGEVEKKLDLYQTYNKLLDLHDAVEADEEGRKPRGAWSEMVIDWLHQLGFEDISHRAADLFATRVFERVQALKNADGGAGRQDSPASTGATSAD